MPTTKRNTKATREEYNQETFLGYDSHISDVLIPMGRGKLVQNVAFTKFGLW